MVSSRKGSAAVFHVFLDVDKEGAAVGYLINISGHLQTNWGIHQPISWRIVLALYSVGVVYTAVGFGTAISFNIGQVGTIPTKEPVAAQSQRSPVEVMAAPVLVKVIPLTLL